MYSKSEYTLTPSTHHNFSYWISDTLKPVATAIGYTFQEPFETDRTLIYRNAMKVSSVNNPFYFPAETTYTIGTGTILNAGTNAQRMSEGQFGQYDLYVLTTEGMYSLDTGTEISYNRQSPASLIPGTIDPCSLSIASQAATYVLYLLYPPLFEEDNVNTARSAPDFAFISQNHHYILY